MDELKPCLIDRNKIPFKELWREASYFADDIVCAVGTDFMTKIAEAERKFICDLLNSLQQMEVVDVAPVVHGRWVEKEKYTFGIMYDCSLCENRILDNGHSWNYCPNCGAKMDGGDDNSDMA